MGASGHPGPAAILLDVSWVSYSETNDWKKIQPNEVKLEFQLEFSPLTTIKVTASTREITAYDDHVTIINKQEAITCNKLIWTKGDESSWMPHKMRWGSHVNWIDPLDWQLRLNVTFEVWRATTTSGILLVPHHALKPGRSPWERDW